MVFGGLSAAIVFLAAVFIVLSGVSAGQAAYALAFLILIPQYRELPLFIDAKYMTDDQACCSDLPRLLLRYHGATPHFRRACRRVH